MSQKRGLYECLAHERALWKNGEPTVSRSRNHALDEVHIPAARGTFYGDIVDMCPKTLEQWTGPVF